MIKVKRWGLFLFITICLGIFQLPADAEAQTSEWIHTSGPVGGESVTSIHVDGDTIYAATFGRGIWRSPDGGSTWNYLYGTFDFSGDLLLTSYGRLLEANEDGIRYSDDGGTSWTEKDFEREAEQLESGYGIIAARMDEISYEVHDSYIRVSTDSGKTWMQTHIDSAEGVNYISDLAVISDDSLLASTDKGVYTMTMEDTTWEQSSLTGEINALAMADGRIFADMYRSTDMGASWESLDSYPFDRVNQLEAAPSGDVYALVTDTAFHSPDFGSSWSNLTEENVARLDIRSTGIDPNGNLYLGLYESGLFRYSTDMEEWDIIGPPSTNVLDMYTKSDGNVLAGTERSGLNMYMPSQGKWSKKYGPYEGNMIGVIDRAGDRLIMGRTGPSVYTATVEFSDDGGETWTVHDSAIVAENFENVTPTAYANSDDGMFMGTRALGVFHSSDGTSWEAASDSLPFEEVYELEVDSTGTVLASGDRVGLYQWNAAETYWSKIKPSADTLLDTDINSIAVHPSGAVIADRWIRPAESTSWDTLHMPDNNAYYDVEVEVMEITKEGNIYLASWNGAVYKSDDMAESWETIATEFGGDDEGLFTNMTFTEDKVLLATENRGVYQWSRTSTSIDPKNDDIPNKITLKQNYPNPFNPTTTLQFTLPRTSDVQLTAYNTIGQKVRTLINRKMTGGKHSVRFDASGLPSGVYIYRLKAGEYRESRKMLLVK